MSSDTLDQRIIGAAIAVHKSLGPGFTEPIYHRAMLIELARREIPFESERTVRVFYDGQEVGMHRLDLVVGERFVVELKAVCIFLTVHFDVVRSYMKAIDLGASRNWPSAQLRHNAAGNPQGLPKPTKPIPFLIF